MKQVTVFALVALAALAVAAPQGKTDNLVTKSNSKQCEGTECPAGCCPEVGWFCCPDNLYCAATAADCPAKDSINKIINLATKSNSKQCEGTECPAGCCPEVGWFCCPDNLYCAATAADCPAKKTISKAIKLAANNTPHRCYGTGEPCPGNMFCCPDERCYLLFCP